MITRRTLIKGTASAAALMISPRTLAARTVHVETGPAFGSAWRLVIASPESARAARVAIATVIERIDGLMSPFRSDSELFRFNAGDGRGFALSPETVEVTARALELADASDGAFDPTSAPIGRRFGYGAGTISPSRPAACHGGLSLSGRQLTAARPGISLDLCAVAKGYALDRIVANLDGLDFVFELGGEVVARGRHPSGRPWRLGIERPGSPELQRIFEAGQEVLATSANGQEGFTFRGRQYGHVVDPRTARPVDNGVASVSVLAASGELADGLATAALVLGPGAATDLLRSFDARALFLVRDGQGLRAVDVQGFARGISG